MVAYLVYGYTRDEDRDDWEIYRAFTSRKEAEKKAIEISGNAYDEQIKLYEKWNYIKPQAECDYNGDELQEIFDCANFTFIIRIAEIEID